MSEEILIRQGAPTLAGIKTGSLFPCPCDDREALLTDVRRLNRQLVPKGLCLLPIRFKDGQALLYLYRPAVLHRDLQDGLAQRILTQAGYRVGLYTSPHLDRFNERFRIRGEEISDAAFADLVSQGRAVWETMEDKPTEFEVITALAFLYFAQSACDLVVLEVGLGGRLDATNVIPTPLAAVITKLGLDHTAELGDTLAQIAYEKAGIVKPGGWVVLDGRNTEVLEQLQQLCRERTCSTAITRPDQLTVSRQDITGSTFSYGPWRDLRLTLAGSYQPGNAALALETVEVLRAQGWSVSDDAVRAGLAAVRWPGRFELLCQDPIFLLDGAHNPDGVRAAVESLSACFPGQKLRLLVGFLADKDIPGMVAQLAPLAQELLVITPPSPRAMEEEDLVKTLARTFPAPVKGFASIRAAVDYAFATARPGERFCALGSLYSAGTIRQAVQAARP